MLDALSDAGYSLRVDLGTLRQLWSEDGTHSPDGFTTSGVLCLYGPRGKHDDLRTKLQQEHND